MLQDGNNADNNHVDDITNRREECKPAHLQILNPSLHLGFRFLHFHLTDFKNLALLVLVSFPTDLGSSS